ncbi:MAG: cell wall-binding repeat-containing protein [Actinomycetota bacterium]|nr:cell wall-binding repeat-containing protein [Actinomycetota bacterium]
MAGAIRGRAGAPKASIIGTLTIITALIVSLLTPVSASAAPSTATAVEATGIVPAADLSQFQPGNIVSDAVFFYKDSMTEAQIQAFLESKVTQCASGYTCLKDYYDTARTISADAMCGAYAGGTRERASRIIYKVAQACGINPQVILVMLQKEQGLVRSTAPSAYNYRAAMGQGCPDTAACDTRYYGLFNQVFWGAWQLKRYANPPGTSQYFTWYAPGKTWNVRWHPNAACGSSPVYIQNQATSNLYYYTPYQPNAAALRAGYGTGDGCSSYGNRNFFNYFTDWFGSTQVPANACSQPGSVAAADGEFTVNVASLNGRLAPNTLCETDRVSLSQGTVVTRTGTSGNWWRVRLEGRILWVASEYLVPTPAPTYTAARVSGGTRYSTAVEVSRRTNPNGSPTVYLASGENYPDALSGSALAAGQSSALLLTMTGALPTETAAELVRLAPTKVVLLGGEASISKGVETAVSTLMGPGVTVERLAGGNRYATSVAVADKGWTTAPVAYLATGRGFADALSVSAVAAAVGAPVILVDGALPSLDQHTLDALTRLGVKSVVIAGGPVSISEGIASQLRGLGITVDRKGGANRWETSVLLASSAYPSTASSVYVASGELFPDALTGTILAARQKSPLLVTFATCLTGTAKNYMISHGTKTATLVGGPVALTDSVLRSVRC